MTLPLEKEEQVNKGGRPVGSSTKISKLQRISTKLNKMANEDAIPLLEKSLAGEPIDKERLASAKFVVTTAKQYHQAILAEKDALEGGKNEGKQEGEVPEDDENAPAKFSLKIVKNG